MSPTVAITSLSSQSPMVQLALLALERAKEGGAEVPHQGHTVASYPLAHSSTNQGQGDLGGKIVQRGQNRTVGHLQNRGSREVG